MMTKEINIVWTADTPQPFSVDHPPPEGRFNLAPAVMELSDGDNEKEENSDETGEKTSAAIAAARPKSPERSSGPGVRTTRGTSRSRGKASAKSPEKKDAPKKHGRGRGVTKAPAPALRKRKLRLPTPSDEEDQEESLLPKDTTVSVPSPPGKDRSPPSAAQEIGGSSDAPGETHSRPNPDIGASTASAFPAGDKTEAPSPPAKKTKFVLVASRQAVKPVTAAVKKATKKPITPPLDSPSHPLISEDVPKHPGPPTWLSDMSTSMAQISSCASSWYTEASTYMDPLSEENQALRATLKDNQAAISEVASLRSSLKQSEEQVAHLLQEHDKIFQLESENVNLQKVNEELKQSKRSWEEKEATLLAKIESMKTILTQRICESGSAMLGIAKSHYPDIEEEVLSAGFNCDTFEEAEELTNAMKPTCVDLIKKMGLDSLSSDEK